MSPQKKLDLAPLPRALQVIPGFVAPEQQRLVLKETDKHWSKKHSRICYMNDKDKPAERYGSIDEVERNKLYAVQDVNKIDIYQISRGKASRHTMQYTATSTQGQILWVLDINRHWTRSTKYDLRIHPGTSSEQSLELQKKFNGEQIAIMVGGMPAAVLGESSSHLNREDEIHVAAGMDTSLAIGIAYVHYLKGCMDDKDNWNLINSITGNVGGGNGFLAGAV